MKVVIDQHELDPDKVNPAVSIEVESVDVTPLMTVEPDMGWQHVDSNGHWHAFSDDGELPTLQRESRPVPDCEADDEDPDLEIVFTCRACGEEVDPVWKQYRTTYRVYEPGRLAWRVDLRAVGYEADLLRSLRGKSVSIRVIEAKETTFGVGVVKLIGLGSLGLEVQILGTSPLGKRKKVV